MCGIPGRSRLAEGEPIVVAEHRALIAAAARPVLTGHLARPPVGRRAGHDVVAVRRALRVDLPSLLVERGVGGDVRLVGMQLGYRRGDQLALGVVPGTGADAVARVDAARSSGTEIRPPRAVAGAGFRGQRLAVLVSASEASEIAAH